MRPVVKGPEPATFTTWKAANPTAVYNDLPLTPDGRAAKSDLRVSLLAEQRGLCCYCESRVVSGDFHIEHFRPKAAGKFPHLQLDYNNLHACCHSRPVGGGNDCCGHKKSDDFHNDLISPLEPDCHTHFTYTLDGRTGDVDNRATITSRMLNLNSSQLINSRKSLIDYFPDLDDADLQDEIRRHLDSTAPVFGEFYSMIEFLSASGKL